MTDPLPEDVKKVRNAMYPDIYGPGGLLERGFKVSRNQRAKHSQRAIAAMDALRLPSPPAAEVWRCAICDSIVDRQMVAEKRAVVHRATSPAP